MENDNQLFIIALEGGTRVFPFTLSTTERLAKSLLLLVERGNQHWGSGKQSWKSCMKAGYRCIRFVRPKNVRIECVNIEVVVSDIKLLEAK